MLVLGYGVYTGAVDPGQLFGELSGRDAGSGDSGRAASGSGPSTAPGAPAPPSRSQARSMLRGIEVAPAGSMVGYSREEFPHWAADGTEFGWDEPDGSCDVRDDALVRDGRGVEVDEENRGPRQPDLTLAPTPRDDSAESEPIGEAWRSVPTSDRRERAESGARRA